MAYDPRAHTCLEELSTKYHDWYLNQARSAHEAGMQVYDADGFPSTLTDCYRDAMITAEALYAYLVDHPPPPGTVRPEIAPRLFPSSAGRLDAGLDFGAL